MLLCMFHCKPPLDKHVKMNCVVPEQPDLVQMSAYSVSTDILPMANSVPWVMDPSIYF